MTQTYHPYKKNRFMHHPIKMNHDIVPLYFTTENKSLFSNS